MGRVIRTLCLRELEVSSFGSIADDLLTTAAVIEKFMHAFSDAVEERNEPETGS